MNLESLRSLQKRIRESKGVDPRLDRDIAFALTDWTLSSQELPPIFTADPDGLGACVALMRTVLPGWTRVVDASAPELGIAVELMPPDDASPQLQAAKIKGDHDLEPHAFLDAICAALIAEEKSKGESRCRLTRHGLPR